MSNKTNELFDFVTLVSKEHSLEKLNSYSFNSIRFNLFDNESNEKFISHNGVTSIEEVDEPPYPHYTLVFSTPMFDIRDIGSNYKLQEMITELAEFMNMNNIHIMYGNPNAYMLDFGTYEKEVDVNPDSFSVLIVKEEIIEKFKYFKKIWTTKSIVLLIRQSCFDIT